MMFLFGCGLKAVKPETPMDSPAHHYIIGMNLFDRGEYQKALDEFERAKSLDPKYAPSYVGIGLAKAEQNQFDEAFSAMKQAKKLASSSADKVVACTGMIRVYTRWQGEDWLDEAENYFSKAKSEVEDDPAPYYYMALAYKTGKKYEESAVLFKRVIDLNKGYVEEADMGWEAVQRIQRAMPGTRAGKRIAGVERITRADVAALFIEELNLERLFLGIGVKPQKKAQNTDDFPTDYQNHVLRADIDEVIDLGIRGLEPIGNRFEPDKEIIRANFAIMIEDVLIRVTDEKALSDRHIGAVSPFKDVDSSNYAFNAIITCITRGVMKSDIYGNFYPMDPVSGADSLLIIRHLKDALEQ